MRVRPDISDGSIINQRRRLAWFRHRRDVPWQLRTGRGSQATGQQISSNQGFVASPINLMLSVVRAKLVVLQLALKHLGPIDSVFLISVE